MPRCRLFLVTPPDGDPDRLARALSAAVEQGNVASLLIRCGDDDSGLRALTDALMPVAFAHNVAVLLDDRPELAAELGADGVQVPGDAARYAEARRILGTDHIVGTYCDTSRHTAMELGEAGADYVALDQEATANAGGASDGEPIIGWWAALFEVPCVAYRPAGERDVAMLISQGADFIRPPDEMWQSAEHARNAIRRLNTLIGEGAPA